MSSKPSQLNINGKIIDDGKKFATNFNNFFVVGQNTENAIPKVPNISSSKFSKNRIQTNFIIAHIANEEILCKKVEITQVKAISIYFSLMLPCCWSLSN